MVKKIDEGNLKRLQGGHLSIEVEIDKCPVLF